LFLPWHDGCRGCRLSRRRSNGMLSPIVPIGEKRDQHVGVDADPLHRPWRPMSLRASRTSSTGSPGPTLILPSQRRKAGSAACTPSSLPTQARPSRSGTPSLVEPMVAKSGPGLPAQEIAKGSGRRL
jgi:hypothetical protein